MDVIQVGTSLPQFLPISGHALTKKPVLVRPVDLIGGNTEAAQASIWWMLLECTGIPFEDNGFIPSSYYISFPRLVRVPYVWLTVDK